MQGGGDGNDVCEPVILDDEVQDTFVNPGVDAFGIDGGPGDDGALAVATGTFDFDAGTDGLKKLEITSVGVGDVLAPLQAIFVDPATGQGTPENVNVLWTQNPGDAGGTFTGTGVSGQSVFTLVVEADGDYTFSLFAPLAHSVEDDPDTVEVETEFEDNISLVFGTRITDGDDDTSESTLTIAVDDDTPDAAPAAIEVSSTPADPAVVGLLNFEPGADGWSGASLLGNTPPPGLESNGNPVQYYVSADGMTLIGYIGAFVANFGPPPLLANQVFTLTVNPGVDTAPANDGIGGNYTFDLLQPIDAPAIQLQIVGGASFGAGPEDYQILSTGAGGTGEQLSVASGWHTSGAFNPATWLATGVSTGVTHADINGSTGGWGVDNNNFTTGEFMRFDFSSQALENFDGAGGYVPPAVSLPDANQASFTFPFFASTDGISYVAFFSGGGREAATLADPTLGLVVNAPAGQTINHIEFYANSASGSGKVDLGSVAAEVEGGDVNLSFNLALSDGDGDTETVALAVTVTAPPPVANGETIFINNDGADIPEWLLLLNDTNAVDVQDGNPVSESGADVSRTNGGTNGGDGTGFLDFNDDGTLGGSFNYRVESAGGDLSLPASGATATINNNSSSTVVGGTGMDILYGFTGNDLLVGDAESDTYAFRADNDGSDDINDTGGTADRIMIGALGAAITGLNFESANADGDGAGVDDLRILYNGEQIDVINHYNANGADPAASTPGVGAMETITFVGGATYLGYAIDGNPYALNADRLSPMTGTSGNDILASDSGPETVNGGDGNDLLFGNGGDDSLDGGTGTDLIIGGTGSDTMTGGTQSDMFAWRAGEQGTAVNNIAVYNFAGVTQATDNHFAFYFEVDPSDTTPEIDDLTAFREGNTGFTGLAEATNAEYIAIASNDGSRWTTPNPGVDDHAVFWAQVDIAEAAASITQFQVLINGQQGGNPSSGEDGHLGIWNYTDGVWEVIDTEHFEGGTDGNWAGTISTNISEYLDPSTNQLTFALINEDDNDPLLIDYVEVTVTTPGTPTTVDTILDFTPGVGGDILNFDNLLPGAINNGTALATLDDHLQFSFAAGDTTVHVDHDGGAAFNPTMNVVLDGVDITAGGTLTNQQVLQNLLDNGNLQV
jgi:Ca2+-binding RTX toxin-like protein